MARTIRGVTRDKDGGVLVSCECFAFKDNGATMTFIGFTTSDGSGNFEISGASDNDAAYVVYFVKDDTPHVFDCTDRNLRPEGV